MKHSDHDHNSQLHFEVYQDDAPYADQIKTKRIGYDQHEDLSLVDDEMHLLSNKKKVKNNSSKFVGYRKSFLSKLKFQFPSSFRSKRLDNQKLVNIKRPESVLKENSGNFTELNQELKKSMNNNNCFSRIILAINEKIFPSRFILNNESTENNGTIDKIKSRFSSFKK